MTINAGGHWVSPYAADVSFTGGTTINHANAIDLSGVSGAAPTAVYQTARVGNFSYTIGGFTSMSSHTVRLHLCDTYFATAGVHDQRQPERAIRDSIHLRHRQQLGLGHRDPVAGASRIRRACPRFEPEGRSSHCGAGFKGP